MALEALRRVVFEVSGRKGQLEAERERRALHLQEITLFSSHHHHPADDRVREDVERRMGEIQAELDRHKR